MDKMVRCVAALCALGLVGGCGPGDETTSSAPPPFACGATGQLTQEVMRDLNGFWGTRITACSCMNDAPSVCWGGAFVSNDPRFIYYDVQAMTRLDQISGSRLPADMVMAHEAGHVLQLLNRVQNFGKARELQADCLAGYYVGSRIRRGTVTQNDVTSTYNTSCLYGDAYLAPWWEPGAHGTCGERVTALQIGIQGNLRGVSPWMTCS